MHTRIFAFIAAFLLATNTFAAFESYEHGPIVGLDAAFWSKDDMEVFEDYSISGGGFIGYKVSTPLTTYVNMSGEVTVNFYELRNESRYYDEEVSELLSFTTINVPILFNLHTKGNRFYGTLGPQIRFNANVTEEVVYLDKVTQKNVDYVRSGELGITCGFGFNMKNFDFGMRLNQGLTNIFKTTKFNQKIDIKNVNFQLYVAYMFGRAKN